MKQTHLTFVQSGLHTLGYIFCTYCSVRFTPGLFKQIKWSVLDGIDPARNRTRNFWVTCSYLTISLLCSRFKAYHGSIQRVCRVLLATILLFKWISLCNIYKTCFSDIPSTPAHNYRRAHTPHCSSAVSQGNLNTANSMWWELALFKMPFWD